MARRFSPKVVTANDLLSGDVIYLSSSDQWVHWHKDAELISDPDHAAVRLDFASKQQGKIVGAYLADAVTSETGPVPVHFRETFRSRGPSNLPHGKQSELKNVSV